MTDPAALWATVRQRAQAMRRAPIVGPGMPRTDVSLAALSTAEAVRLGPGLRSDTLEPIVAALDQEVIAGMKSIRTLWQDFDDAKKRAEGADSGAASIGGGSRTGADGRETG